MGLRGPGGRWLKPPKTRRTATWSKRGRTRARRVIAFIESLRVTSGALAGQPFTLRPWQREIIESWYAVDAGGRRVVRTGC